MNGNARRSLVAALVLLLATLASAAQATKAPPAPSSAAPAASAATPVAKARSAARANAATALGRDWKQKNGTAVGAPLIPVLNKCLPEDADEVTAFSVFVRLSQKGRVREVVTDLSAELGACMTAGASELQLPTPPRDDYWFQLNLATEL